MDDAARNNTEQRKGSGDNGGENERERNRVDRDK